MSDQNEITEIKNLMSDHFKDDRNSFSSISTALSGIHEKLDDHIMNFKEQKVLHEKVREEMKAEYMELKLAISEQDKKMKPMTDTFSNLKWGEKILVKFGIFLGSLVTFLWGIGELVKTFSNLKK